ncbi:YbjN domain-containing protein [Qipengyuania sp.]|uniref:YbjN domain-containing protein n=1 Tax=Qipengyuania sp. TaxID=2004515 RepID=UPI003735DF0A
MTLARADRAATQEAEPLAMLRALFKARDWPCSDSQDELSGEIQGSWAKYHLRAIWRRGDQVLQLLCLPDIRVNGEKRAAAYELLSMVNEQTWLGHFDMWSSSGVLLYRSGTLLGEGGMLGLGQAQSLVEIAVEECDRFYPAFQFVLWGDKTPAEALDAAMVDAAGEA